jgi:hypothetical protein
VYLASKVVIGDVGGPFTTLHESKEIIPVSMAAMFDSTQVPPPVGNNRLFYGVYAAGDRELGLNLRVSWGGPAKPFAQQLKLVSGLFEISNGNFPSFQMGYNMQLKALYYS